MKLKLATEASNKLKPACVPKRQSTQLQTEGCAQQDQADNEAAATDEPEPTDDIPSDDGVVPDTAHCQDGADTTTPNGGAAVKPDAATYTVSVSAMDSNTDAGTASPVDHTLMTIQQPDEEASKQVCTCRPIMMCVCPYSLDGMYPHDHWQHRHHQNDH